MMMDLDGIQNVRDLEKAFYANLAKPKIDDNTVLLILELRRIVAEIQDLKKEIQQLKSRAG